MFKIKDSTGAEWKKKTFRFNGKVSIQPLFLNCIKRCLRAIVFVLLLHLLLLTADIATRAHTHIKCNSMAISDQCLLLARSPFKLGNLCCMFSHCNYGTCYDYYMQWCFKCKCTIFRRTNTKKKKTKIQKMDYRRTHDGYFIALLIYRIVHWPFKCL